MKPASIVVAAAALAIAQAAAAQSGCRPGFVNTQSFFPHNEAPASASPLQFGAGEALGNVRYRPIGESADSTLEEYLGKFCTTGLLVLHDRRIVFERYLQGVQPGDALLSASMSKTILALLIGVAVSEGKLALDQRVGDLLPDFRASAFGEDTIEDLLRMTSGVALKASYVRGGVADNRATDPMVSPRQDMRAYLRGKTERDPAGKRFDYNGAVSALLGIALSERTGKSNTAYLADRLWAPMGAEGNGYWIKNLRGEEGVQGQFVATLRDYARLGYLVMNQGEVNGHHVVPAAWIAQMTALRGDRPQPARPPFYGLHIWIPQAAGGRSFFWGAGGQNIFVDPVARVVIVHTANSPDADFQGNRHLFALRDAIVRELAGRPAPDRGPSSASRP
jgi:CubicO group peptidase (beta-lactamase class C family)